MKGHLSLEYIGANTFDAIRNFEGMMALAGVKVAPEDRLNRGPAVAEVIIDEDGRAARRWMYGKRDYSHVNSKGSRGVRVNYVLEEDRLYWVQAPQSWRRTDRYFAAVTAAGDVRRLTDEEAGEWLSSL